MSQLITIHPENPQERLINQAVEVICNGGIIVYPTDSGYALGSRLGNQIALKRICKIRQLDEKHNFTLICLDLCKVGQYAYFSTPVFRVLKANTPGAYTFILHATKEVPRRLMHPKKKTIGIRIPNNKIVQSLLMQLNEPIISTSLILPGEESPMTDPVEIKNWLDKDVELIIDGGLCGIEPTTLIDFLEDTPKVIRKGKGDITPFI